MRTLKKNKQELEYALLEGEVPILTEDGLETGEYELGYSQPVPFSGNIAMSGGESEAKEFGVSTSDYDAVLVMDKDEIPITETSLIWHENEVGYKDTDKAIVDGNSADYKVKKVSPSLNQIKYLLQRIEK